MTSLCQGVVAKSPVHELANRIAWRSQDQFLETGEARRGHPGPQRFVANATVLQFQFFQVRQAAASQERHRTGISKGDMAQE